MKTLSRAAIFSTLGVIFVLGVQPAHGTGFALSFDGIDDYVRVPHSADLTIRDRITLEAWVFLPETNRYVKVISKADETRSEGNYNLLLKGAVVTFSYWDGDGWNSYHDSFATLETNRWYHIAATYDFATFAIALYIDGRRESGAWQDSATADPPNRSTPVVNSNPLVIGSDIIAVGAVGEARSSFHGMIDEVRIWNCLRTQAEIVQNRCRRLTGQESCLLGYWTFDEGAGTVAQDASPAMRTGELGGGIASREPVWVLSAIPDCTPAPFVSLLPAIELCFPTVTNRQYQPQWALSVDTADWTNFGPVISGTGTNAYILDSTRGTEKRFYRVHLLPEE